MQTRWTQARLIEELDFVRSFFILESSYQADSNLPILHAIRKGPWQTLATVMTIGWFVGHRLATPSKRIIINGLQKSGSQRGIPPGKRDGVHRGSDLPSLRERAYSKLEIMNIKPAMRTNPLARGKDSQLSATMPLPRKELRLA
jgi:hypothetical protein